MSKTAEWGSALNAIYGAKFPEDVLPFLDQLDSYEDDARWRVLSAVVQRLRELEYSGYLSLVVELCLRETGPDAHWLQNHLSDWLKSEGHAIRENVVATIAKEASGDPYSSRTLAAVWTLSAIGLRTPDATAALERLSGISARDVVPDRVRDAALDVLVWLGYPDREALLGCLKERLAEDAPPSLSVIGALRQLAEPALIDDVIISYRRWIEEPDTTRLMARALVDTADLHPDIAPVAWREIVSSPLVVELLGSSDLAQKVDDSGVPVHLLRSLEAGLEDGYQNPEYITPNFHLYLRLSELLRPRQLSGVSAASASLSEEQLTWLSWDATSDTRSTGRWQTGPMLSKESCWEAILRLALPQTQQWIIEAINDTSQFVAMKLIETASLLRVTTIIPRLAEIVSSVDTPDTVGLAAVRSLGLMSDSRAWDALMNSRVMVRGHLPAALPDALASLALSLSSAEPIIEQLEHPTADLSLWLGCAVALQHVSFIKPSLVISHKERVMRLLRGTDAYLRQGIEYIVSAAGAMQPDGDIAGLLAEWASTGSEALSTRSMETLARWHDLAGREELLAVLGLRREGSDWKLVRPLSEQRAFLLGLLYCSEPQAFLAAVSQALRQDVEGFQSGAGLLAALGEQADLTPLEDSLFSRALSGNSAHRSEPGILGLIAAFFPRRFVREFSAERCAGWFAPAREAIVDTLKSLQVTGAEAALVTESLLMFVSDPVYTVRRKAAIALLDREVGALAGFVNASKNHDSCQQRVFAVEASSWLPDDGDFTSIIQSARTDPERDVREAAEAVRQERNERSWASAYLTEVLNANADDLLPVWRYGKALVDIGDDRILTKLTDAGHDPRSGTNKRAWLLWIAKDLEKKWADRERKWRER